MPSGPPTTQSPAWARFSEWMATLRDLGGVQQLLAWDQEATMPRAGVDGRANLTGTLAAIAHRELIRPDIAEAIEAIADDPELLPERRAMVRLADRECRRARAVPEELVRRLSEATSRCTSVWRVARGEDDFASFAAAFSPVLDAQREVASLLAPDGEPYDALLDRYEPGVRAADLVPLFADLRRHLVPLVERCRDFPALPPGEGEWPHNAQLELAHRIAKHVGFDLGGGLIGLTTHPFTVITHAGDVRFSTDIATDDPLKNVQVTLHELGHALYDQGLPSRHSRTMLFEAPSLGAQESQSRFYEMHVGCEDAFWHLLTPDLLSLFPERVRDIDAGALAARTRAVRPGPLRLAADEVTYNLHIVLRFELEVAMMRGDLAVADLPAAWSDGAHELLGVRPTNHREGALQDIHWAGGDIGYFPTYTLGNVYAAQLRAALEDEHGPLQDILAAGDLGLVLGFMRDRVHSHGAMLDTQELMHRATGRPLRSDELVGHLTRRYLHRGA